MNFIQKPPKINLHVLRERLFSLLQVSRYADNSINTYRKIFNLLEAYLSEKECDYYDSSIGKDFLASCKKYRGKNIDEKRRTKPSNERGSKP